MKLSTLKKYWIVAFANGNVAYWSIAATKRGSIHNFLEGITPTRSDAEQYWKKSKRRGNRCIRVNIQFDPVTPTPKKIDTTDWYADPGASGKVDF